MRKNILYVVGIFIAVTWLWNNNIEALRPNLAYAIGYNLFSLGGPLVLLWYAAKELHIRPKEQGSTAPYKLVLGSITCICTLLAILDAFNPHDPHKIGAALLTMLFGTASVVLFGLAYIQQRRSSRSELRSGA